MKTKSAHKKFKIGQMVAVLWHKNWYVGKYYGWSEFFCQHMVRFPVRSPWGMRLEILFVKDSYGILPSSQYPFPLFEGGDGTDTV